MPSDRPPLQRIWAQHAALHQRVQALHTWLETLSEPRSWTVPHRLLEEIQVLLPEHFALEEAQGYFADVLRVAPHLEPRAARLRAHHGALVPQLDDVLDALRRRCDRSLDASVLQQIEAFLQALEHHEQGESELVRDAFQGIRKSRTRVPEGGVPHA